MPPARALASIIWIVWIVAAIASTARPAMAQICSHDGPLVNCDDGRRGLLLGDVIIWADGARSSASPPAGGVIGSKPSVQMGEGVSVGKGSGTMPPDDKTRCAVLDDVTYCY
jgi:hypothetical protein